MDAVPNDEKIAIAQYYLQSSPPGQIDYVLEDVNKLLPPGLLDEATKTGIYRSYNVDQLITVVHKDHKVPMSKAGEVDPTHYVDTVEMEVIEVDHLKRKVLSSAPLKAGIMDSKLEDMRSALQAAINSYMDHHYSKELTGCGVYARGGEIHVIISSESVQLRNFWSGRWRAQYTIVPSGSSAKLSGSVKIRCHYFEDGNLQLHQDKNFPTTAVSYSDPASFASNTVQLITKLETDLQAGLEAMYGTMNDETFKEMRRVLPLSKEKFKWNAAAHKMVRNLRK